MTIQTDSSGSIDEIVCAVTNAPAELFIRNANGRLVPLTRTAFARLSVSRKSMQSRSNRAEISDWISKPLDELSLQNFSGEYKNQEPSDAEKKRRTKVLLYSKLQIEKIIYSTSGPVDESELQQHLPEGKTLSDYVISKLNKYPSDDVYTVIISSHPLDPGDMKMIWDVYLSQQTHVKPPTGESNV